MRVHLKTLGCRLNEAELETWSREFQQQGHRLVQSESNADLVVVNTCAVTQEAVKKSRNLIRRAQKTNPMAKLVISGCYSSLNSDEAEADLGVDLIIPNGDKQHLVELVSQELEFPVMPISATESYADDADDADDDDNAGGEADSLLARGRQRAFIKVQDGCRYRCTYCIVTIARGDEQSRPIQEIIDEINGLHSQGILEIVLTGVHLGGYGDDLGMDLSTLIEAVLRDTEIPRIRLGSLEPWDLPDDFWGFFSNQRLMPHLHLPLQSGSDTVLRRMARRCKTEAFRDLVHAAKKAVPNINITTDIIVGFPGETEDEWQETLAFVEEMAFGHIHIFAYSARKGTKAATLDNQLDRATKRGRSQQLHQLASRMKLGKLQGSLNQDFSVLIEGSSVQDDGSLRWSGYTPNYLPVLLRTDARQNLANQVIQAKVIGIDSSSESLLITII